MTQPGGDETAEGSTDRQERRPGHRGQRIRGEQFASAGDVRNDSAPGWDEHGADDHLKRSERVQPADFGRFVDDHEAEHDERSSQIRHDHQKAPVEAVDQESRERRRQGEWEDLDDECEPEREGGSGQLPDQRVEGDRIQPIAEEGGDIGHPQTPKRTVRAQEFGIADAASCVDRAGL